MFPDTFFQTAELCVCGHDWGGVGVMVFDLLWRLEQQDSAESRLAQQARREWHFLFLSRPAESLDNRDLVLSYVPVHHHQNQPPTAGGEGGLGYLCHPNCPRDPSSFILLLLLPPALSLALLQRDQKASLSWLPDCFCSCEQTNRVWPLTKENAEAHLILLP